MTIESFLARVYTDASLRAAFLADPVGVARRAGLPEAFARHLAHVDRVGFEMQAESFAAKRGGGRRRPS